MGRASFSLRRTSVRPGARPTIALGAGREPGPNGIQKNVSLNLPKLRSIPHQPIVTLVLPEGPALLMEQSVSFPSRRALKPLQECRNIGPRRNHQVDMVRHDHPRVQVVVPAPVLNRANHQPRHLRQPEIPRPNDRPVQQSIHVSESFARSYRLPGKTLSRRQCAVEAKGNEQWPAQYIQMGQMTSHRVIVPSAPKKSHVKKEAGSSPPQAEACPTHE